MRVERDPGWTFRLLPEAIAQLGITPRGVIHVGAHYGEEVPVYQACGFGRIVLVEADPESCAVIAAQQWSDDVTLVQTACASTAGTARFYRTAETVFSGLHPSRTPTAEFEVPTIPVSAVQADHPANVLVVDTQGTELDVLRSADLSVLDLVIVETQETSRKAHGAYWPDLLAYAHGHGWVPAIQWDRVDSGWADTLLIPAR